MSEQPLASVSVRQLISQPALGDLLASSDVNALLKALLDAALVECQARCGALLFGSGSEGTRVRKGPWSPSAFKQVSRWERAIARSLEDNRLFMSSSPAPAEARLDAGPLRFLVNVPLSASNQVVGSLTLAYADERSAPSEYASLIRRVAANIGGLAYLVENLHFTRHKLSQLQLFFRIGQSMSSTLNLNQLLVDTTSIATNILNAGAASLMLLDEERHELVFEISVGEKAQALRRLRMPLGQGIAGWVAENGVSLIVNDTTRDPRFSHKIDARTGFLTHSVICVPLQIKGKVIGVLEVLNKYSREGFDQEDERLLMTIAGQAAIAIENARLYHSLREERDRLVNAQEEVRRELARNLHDGMVQLLAAITMNIDHVERLLELRPEAVRGELESLRALARQATRQARLLLFELRPVILESRGLVAALKTYVEQLSSNEAFDVILDVDELIGRFPSKIEGTVFSIIQEAFNNIKRHAEAQQVWLRMWTEDDRLIVEVEDDGVGFRRAQVEASYDERGSFGLLNMQERAGLLDGNLEIQSLSEGRETGTLIRLSVPITTE